MHQMSILWDRWESLNKAYNDFDINGTKCLKYNIDELIGSDINDCIFSHKF